MCRYYNVELVSNGLLEGSKREDQVWTRLDTYQLFVDSMIVSKLELGEKHLDGKRYL